MHLKNHAWLGLVAAAFLSGCGGGDGGSSQPPGAQAPSGLSYPAIPALTINVAAAAQTPTVTGTVSSYSVSPALPAGLALNAGSGVINGTPTALSVATNYTVTASNSGGSTSTTVSITVKDVAPAFGYPSSAFIYTKGTPITALAPTSTGGAVVTWSVQPVLPAGLALNASTGAITGSPTAIAAAANYTVTATNSGGNATAILSLTVNDVGPAFSYSPSSLTLSQGLPFTAITPTSTGGAVTTWSVQPALPAGITLNPATGAIGGNPAAVTPRSDYAVTAQNSGGSVVHNISLAVASAVLVDLQLPTGSVPVSATATRLLAGGVQWSLWNATNRTPIARGAGLSTPRPLLAGNTFLVRTTDTVEAHDVADGALLATVPYDGTRSWWALARDGSYFAIGGSSGFTIYSRTGAQRATRAVDYSASLAFADNTTLRIAKAPSGANVFENIDAGDGTLVVSPAFLGTFHSWFGDGQRFFSNTGTTIRVYSLASTQEDIFSLGTLEIYNVSIAGYGGWFTFHDNSYSKPVNIYAVGNSAAPAASFPTPNALEPNIFGGIFAISQGGHQWRIVDLTGNTLNSALVDVPDDISDYGYASFTASDAQHIWLSDSFSRIYDGSTGTSAPQYLGFGSVFDIAASPAKIAIATHGHGIQIYDAQSRVLERAIALHASRLSMSADGSMLAAATSTATSSPQTGDDRTIQLYSLSSGAEINAWPFVVDANNDTTFPRALRLSLNGTTLVIANTAYPAAGGPAIGTGWLPSPDGTYVTDTSGVAGPNMTTNLFQNGVLRQAVPGDAKAWIDDNHLMVNRYAYISTSIWDYNHTEIYDLAGVLQGSVTLAHFPRDVQYAGNNEVYDKVYNDIMSLTSGQVVWTSPNSLPSSVFLKGAVAGNEVVFLTNDAVRIEPR